ncbi:MAG: FAD-dependent oxidoreductase [Acetobacteraceae bacterium]|nr:FAD-dependent oxidoreductase [Acetobacteraceae bacterium]
MQVEHVETLVIGGGQAGLTMSHQLSKRGRPHLVLERHRIAERWRTERWDGLRFQTPNALVQLPDFPLPHTGPDGFASRDEIVDFIAAYASFIAAPVRCGVEVTALRRSDGAAGFMVETSGGRIEGGNVVVATGPFQRPIVPALLPEGIGVLQLHAGSYRDPGQLPEGAVLVVGAGASGAQIAEELMRVGRRVYLSVGKHRRTPRRYRGHDHVWWWIETGMDKTPADKRGPDRSPLVHTGAHGGHTIDFRNFAAQGVVLLGRAEAARDGIMAFAPDLLENLAHGDAAFLGFMDFVDAHIARVGLDMLEDPDARVMTAAPASLAEPMRRLDLRAAGIGTVIWATGYGFDFGWIDVPVLDVRGAPVHRGGVTDVPGLYFLGLPFLSQMSSSFLFGVGDDAARLADHIAARV